MDWSFLQDTLNQLLVGIPLTLQLASVSLLLGFIFAIIILWISNNGPIYSRWLAKLYVEIFRGTPLLVQMFLIYYGLGQIQWLRESFLWTYLKEPYWCAVFALALNTSAYTSEIIRGSLQSVPLNEVEAARAYGMSGWLLRRRIIWPIALRLGLPIYGSEIILMVKGTALASIITLYEVTGISYKIISQSYRIMEVFIVAGSIYLMLNFMVTLVISRIERSLNIGKTLT